ncbi:SdpI family protein [Agrococcus sp. ProA11]|uniref:SdpI family protein n=1 Tax=Agrococcus chionoecetis TaxID=3153752 RepID=UPI003261ACDA
MEAGLVVVALLLVVAAAVDIVVVHLAGVGRIARTSPIGIRARATLASDETWRSAHRAATPVTWLTGAIAVIAALAALGFAAGGASTEATVLVVFGAIVLAVGIALAVWRGIASVR